MSLNRELLERELKLKAVRSSGSGGQHVNKVSTKIELQFSIDGSEILSLDQKEKLKRKLAPKLTNDNRLIMQCGESRSQLKNKNLVIARFFDQLEKGLIEEKKRKGTKVPRRAKLKRLNSKRRQSEKKANRKSPM